MSAISERKWGPWSLEIETLTLVHENEYDVRLGECDTSAAVLDWIGQIAGKDWGTPETLGWLATAFNDLLDLQSNLCGSGRSRTIEDVGAVVRYQLAFHDFLEANKAKWETHGADGLRTVDMGIWLSEVEEFQRQYRERKP